MLPRYEITPGSMGAVGVAIDLLGLESLVCAGTWARPFIVQGEHEDICALIEILNNQSDITHQARPVPYQPARGPW